MMQQPKVSVIIPCKNRAALLRTTLDNLLGQSKPPHQIIVVDDNSTDDFQEVVKDYSGRVLFTTNKGKGPGAGRNTGLELATGDYIKFFDSDDVMTLNTLEVQSALLEETGEPLVYSPYIYASVTSAGNWKQEDVIIQYKPIPRMASLRHFMVHGFFTVIPGFMFRKAFLDVLGPWREDVVAYEDWDYLWRIANYVPNPAHTSDCAMLYRLHGAQTVGQNMSNDQRDLDKLKVFDDLIKRLDSENEALGSFEKQLLIFQRDKSLKLLSEKSEEIFKRWNATEKLPFSLYDAYLRLYSKINRLITKSNWQIMHGINHSEKQFAAYLANLKN